MAVFVSGSDESAGKHHRDTFYQAGFVAPEEDWSRFFVPAWQERVLNGPPQIPYLHMTDIRSPKWRESHDISSQDAERRVDEAVAVIDTMGTLFPVCAYLNAGYFRDKFSGTKIVVAHGKPRPFEPDYACFLAYTTYVLIHLRVHHPEAKRVDFIVERKSDVTNHIQEFHSNMADNFKALGQESLGSLLGELIPGGKDRVPLQAADLLCWHSARSKTKTMDIVDQRRYGRIAHRLGFRRKITHKDIRTLANALGVI